MWKCFAAASPVLSWKSQLPCCEDAQATLRRDPCGEDSTSSTNILGMWACHLGSGSSTSIQAFCSPSLWAKYPNHQSEPLPWIIIVVLSHQVLRKCICIHTSQTVNIWRSRIPQLHTGGFSQGSAFLQNFSFAKMRDLHILIFGSPLESQCRLAPCAITLSLKIPINSPQPYNRTPNQLLAPHFKI